MATRKEKAEEVVNKVKISRYFYDIIVPGMGSYYSDYTVDFESRPVAKCPLHGEDTPSFRVYEDTNSFYCFGCGAGGNIIKLHRLFTAMMNGTEVDFWSAVEFLYKVYIEGREIPNSVVSPLVQVEEKSTPTDLIRLSVYLKDLELILMADKSIPQVKKIQVYSHIDDLRQLVALNEIGAKDALVFLKSIKPN